MKINKGYTTCVCVNIALYFFKENVSEGIRSMCVRCILGDVYYHWLQCSCLSMSDFLARIQSYGVFFISYSNFAMEIRLSTQK